jgi:hypothetical protein
LNLVLIVESVEFRSQDINLFADTLLLLLSELKTVIFLSSELSLLDGVDVSVKNILTNIGESSQGH